ncbi:MAG: serine/threonine protein phosphatase [Rhodobacterales bacterium]|nr:MAG: serine/threonine protein phosphatase [Rhodobacterales bacterium]
MARDGGAPMARKGGAVPALTTRASDALRADVHALLRPIPGGFFEMGARNVRHAPDLDSPPRRVRLSPFRLAETCVTNALFARFIEESGYQTTAEAEGWSAVFVSFLDDPDRHPPGPAATPWWRPVQHARWDQPEGPGSSVEGREDHPVVHVSWFDAQAFCDFTGMRLPTEAEWECAARGGRKRAKFPWGNALEPGGKHLHNVWQGRFPIENTLGDGYAGTAPVRSYPANGYGLYEMTGNVWDWTDTWFGPLPEASMPPPSDPKGPDQGPGKVIRGGSHLCQASYCERYFVHSRTLITPDSSTGHIGFRPAADAG